jgi:myo-inositol 2-dehydrogenase/D-chiro-inositol 1-dehydrogenase
MIDVALFGAGRIGTIHAGNLAKEAGARLKYVVDPNARAAQALADRHGATAATVAQVFDDGSIGAVLICSSTDTHADLIQAAAGAGKQIFCEKPVDLDIDRARTCADAVKRAGVACLIGFQRRYDPTFSALKARIVKERSAPEMLVVTSRDQPAADPVRPAPAASSGHADPRFRHFPVDPRRRGRNGACQRVVPVDPGIAEAGDADCTAVTIRTKRGHLCQINTTGARPTATTSVSRCSAAKACCRPATAPTEVIATPRSAGPAGTFLPRALPRRVRERARAFLRRARGPREAAHDDRRRRESA